MRGVRPTSALSRLGIRLGERRSRMGQGAAALTEEDETNIAGFEALLGQTLEILRRENAALEERDIEGVASCFQEKAALLESLETRQPVIEPLLSQDTPAVAPLRQLIRDMGRSIGNQ